MTQEAAFVHMTACTKITMPLSRSRDANTLCSTRLLARLWSRCIWLYFCYFSVIRSSCFCFQAFFYNLCAWAANARHVRVAAWAPRKKHFTQIHLLTSSYSAISLSLSSILVGGRRSAMIKELHVGSTVYHSKMIRGSEKRWAWPKTCCDGRRTRQDAKMMTANHLKWPLHSVRVPCARVIGHHASR